MELELEEIVATFREEAAEGLASAEVALVALERRPGDAEAIATLFRVMHTIKGNAGSLGFPAVGELAHGLEDVLDRLRKRLVAVTPAMVTDLLRSLDVLRRLLAPSSRGDVALGADERALLDGLLASAAPASPAPVPAEGASAGGRRPADRAEGTLRVDRKKLDRMLNLTGELAIAQRRLRQTLAQGAGQTAAVEIQGESDQLFAELQEAVLQARMVPLGPVFRRYVRTVRDAAVAGGKQARLVVEGDDVEVDTSLVEAIRDPLTHMVRNAVDHGIELPQKRVDAGKHPTGCVTLRARHEGASIVIEVCDDGRGLDRARILTRARALGLTGEVEPSPAELDRLILEPGVSTAPAVTQLSGRGVGLDIVRRNVEALRGSVSIQTVPGTGTTITLRLPLTLAIIAGLNVIAGGETYVIPLDSVVECVELPRSEAPSGEAHGVLSLRGQPLPFVRLRALFRCAGDGGRREKVVVVRAGMGTAGLAIDDVLGESQTVVKPLGRMLQGLAGVSGATVCGDGRVALILDVAPLLRCATVLEQAWTAGRPGSAPGELA